MSGYGRSKHRTRSSNRRSSHRPSREVEVSTTTNNSSKRNRSMKSSIKKLNCYHGSSSHHHHHHDDELIDTVIGGGDGESSTNCSTSIRSNGDEVDTVYVPRRERGLQAKDYILESRNDDSSHDRHDKNNEDNSVYSLKKIEKKKKIKYYKNMKQVMGESDAVLSEKILNDTIDEEVSTDDLLQLLLKAVPVLAKYGTSSMPKTKHAFCRALRKHPKLFERDEIKDLFGHSDMEYRDVVWEAYTSYQHYKDNAMKHMMKKHTASHQEEIQRKDEQITALEEQLQQKDEEIAGVNRRLATTHQRVQDVMNYLNQANDYRTVDVVKKDIATQSRFAGLQKFIPNIEAWKKGYYSGFDNGNGGDDKTVEDGQLHFDDPSHFKKLGRSNVKKKQSNGLQGLIQDLLPATATL